jgi:hypothetical protein
VSESNEQRTTLVLTDVKDEDGSMWRAVKLSDDGPAILGHDLGPGVERVFSCTEYEFERRLSTTETSVLRQLLGVADDGDLLTAIGDRFASTRDLEMLVAEHGIAGRFWSRVGD